MEKAFVLREIRRIASLNSDEPPGITKFVSETGIKPHEWEKYWARWGDALREAGFAPNQWNEGFKEDFLIEKIVELIREIGRFPTLRELRLKAHQDQNFPSVGAFKNRLGSKEQTVSKVLGYCRGKGGQEDIVNLCESTAKTLKAKEIPDPAGSEISAEKLGHVYLMKSGRFYKIGKTNSIGRREYDLAIQLAEKPTTLHIIKTDDPDGIEAYWHTRFKAKRKGGEWFDLSASDVKAFKRWLRIV
jgi:hypothetical protein